MNLTPNERSMEKWSADIAAWLLGPSELSSKRPEQNVSRHREWKT
jgi:hypothetical protein